MNLPDETTTHTAGRAFWRRLTSTPLGFRVRVIRDQLAAVRAVGGAR